MKTHKIQVGDKVTTLKGAGGILKSGLPGVVKQVNRNNIFIVIGKSGYHVKKNEVVKVTTQ